MFKVNDAVSIRFSTLTGVVKGAAIDQTTLAVQYLVEFTDRDGVLQERYFGTDDIAAV